MSTDNTTKPKAMRLKVLTPTYTTLTIKEDLPDYLRKSRSISSSKDVYLMFKHLMDVPRETFIALHLDAKHKIICVDQVSQGSLTASVVHPREVFSSAMLSAASAMIFVHQHPSGNPEPSREDIDITKRLREVGTVMGIKILDHVIVGTDSYISFADDHLL